MRLAALAGLGVLAGCSSATPTSVGTGPASPPAPTTPPPSPASPAGPLWQRLSARGPSARRDYAFAGSSDGTTAYLFGGRHRGTALRDLWIFDEEAATWEKGPNGPPARFGANAVVVGSTLVLFGGQGGPGSFFNDVWEFDGSRWREVSRTPAPEERYGAGGTLVGSRFVISHGFTDSGRFDDTWSWDGSRWRNVSPGSGPTPVKRCLHRIGHVASRDRLVLFGGQTNGTPYLGDTWLYDLDGRRWSEVEGKAPRARNLYASASTPEAFWVFGGMSSGGALGDLWRFDGARWRRVDAGGDAAPERGGIEGATLGAGSMLVFGGTDGSEDFDDLWRLTFA